MGTQDVEKELIVSTHLAHTGAMVSKNSLPRHWWVM